MAHKLVANKWRTPDGTLLWSKYTHDFVAHNDKNGDYYFVDGGNDYIRMSSNKEPMVSECVYSDDSFELVRKCVFRGTFAMDRKKGFKRRAWMPISNMSDAHLCNCIIDSIGQRIVDRYKLNTHMYIKELVYRWQNNIFVPDHEYDMSEETSEPEYIERFGTNQYSPKIQIVGHFYEVGTHNFIMEAIEEYAVDSNDDLKRHTAMHVLNLLDMRYEKLGKEEENVNSENRSDN